MAGKIVERAITVLTENWFEEGYDCVVLVACGNSIEVKTLGPVAKAGVAESVRNEEDMDILETPELIVGTGLGGMRVGPGGRLEGHQTWH